MRHIAKTAYETCRVGYQADGPPWEELSDTDKDTWDAVVLAVVTEHTRRWHDAQRVEIREAMNRLPVLERKDIEP